LRVDLTGQLVRGDGLIDEDLYDHFVLQNPVPARSGADEAKEYKCIF